eukprot:scaffold84690_cov30-Phaeocystis_antarctica.AAC.1
MIKEELLSAEAALGGPYPSRNPGPNPSPDPSPDPTQAALGGIAALALLAGVLGAGELLGNC